MYAKSCQCGMNFWLCGLFKKIVLLISLYIQGDSGGKVSNLGGDSIGQSKKKHLYEHGLTSADYHHITVVNVTHFTVFKWILKSHTSSHMLNMRMWCMFKVFVMVALRLQLQNTINGFLHKEFQTKECLLEFVTIYMRMVNYPAFFRTMC